MRDQTTLPHELIPVGRLWNPQLRTGNFDTSRSPIDTIVLHSMAGSLGGSTAHFQNPTTNTAAHYGIDFQGKVVQWLPESVTGYHAGVYSWNQRSIGVEHEDLGNNQCIRPDALYESSAKLIADIAKEYSIPLDLEHIKLHKELSATQCPGSLDRDRIINRAKELLIPIPQEALHTYELKPSVFMALVTKSGEYDKLWDALGLNLLPKANSGSYKLVLSEVTRLIGEAKASLNATPLSNQPLEVPNPANLGDGLEVQGKPFTQKDIKELLSEFFSVFSFKKKPL